MRATIGGDMILHHLNPSYLKPRDILIKVSTVCLHKVIRKTELAWVIRIEKSTRLKMVILCVQYNQDKNIYIF